MKKHSHARSVFSLLLAAVTVLTVCGGLLPMAYACDCEKTPIVYVHGAQSIYITLEDGTEYAPVDEDDPVTLFTDAIPTLAPLLAKAVATGNWDDYGEAIYNVMEPVYAPVKPNPDGTLPEGSHIHFSWSKDTIPTAHYNDGISTYFYDPDIRLSPLDIADDLNDFIEAVKEKTGHDKVMIVTRCAGGVIVAAYLYKYQRDIGYAGVEKTVFLQSAMEGLDHVEAVLSGNAVVDPDAAYRWMKVNGTLDEIGSDDISDLLNATLNMLYDTVGLEKACEKLEEMYAKLKDNCFAKIIRDYHGICLTTIGCIKDHYEEYKDYVFPTDELKAEYATILEKADDYHYNVQPAIHDMLLEMTELGKSVAVIGDYGDQHAPFFPETDQISDTFASLHNQTIGATCSAVDGRLSDAYIAEQTAKGLDRYISPDKQADLSTCLLPDTTWIIKNLHHSFPGSVDRLMVRFLRDGIDVNSDPNYPQFLNYFADGDRLVPAQEVNENDTDWTAYKEESKNGFLNFIQRFFNKLQEFFRSLQEFIANLLQSVR